MLLEFRISGQHLQRTDNIYLVNLSKNYLKCSFMFTTNEWDDLEKYVTFTAKSKNYRYMINDDVLEVPNDLLGYKYFYIQIYGLNEEKDTILTTNSIVISFDNEIAKPLLIKDRKMEDMINALGEIVNGKVDSFRTDGNKLICYFEDTPIQIIPINDNTLLDFLMENYIEIDTKKLNSKGMLFYERYRLQ